MNRRGFLGLLGKLVTVGSAMSISPAVLAPLKEVVQNAYPMVCSCPHLDADVICKAGQMKGPTWTLAS